MQNFTSPTMRTQKKQSLSLFHGSTSSSHPAQPRLLHFSLRSGPYSSGEPFSLPPPPPALQLLRTALRSQRRWLPKLTHSSGPWIPTAVAPQGRARWRPPDPGGHGSPRARARWQVLGALSPSSTSSTPPVAASKIWAVGDPPRHRLASPPAVPRRDASYGATTTAWQRFASSREKTLICVLSGLVPKMGVWYGSSVGSYF